MKRMKRIEHNHEDTPHDHEGDDEEDIEFTMDLGDFLGDELEREVYLDDTILSGHPARATAFTHYLRAIDQTDGDIIIYISSYGGNFDSTLEIYDVLNSLRNKVYLIAQGKAMSGGAYLLLLGKKGYRFAYPNTTVMVHEMLYSLPDQPRTAQKANVTYYEQQWERFLGILSKHLKLSRKKLDQLIVQGQDTYLTAEQALERGLIDGIIGVTNAAPETRKSPRDK